MISSQLASILETYLSHGGIASVPDGGGGTALLCVDNVDITVASVPDEETVMLFSEVGRLPAWVTSTERGWIAAGADGEDDEESRGLMYDQSSGLFALTDTAPAPALDAQAFAGWVRAFAAEHAESMSAFDEAVAETLSPDAVLLDPERNQC